MILLPSWIIDIELFILVVVLVWVAIKYRSTFFGILAIVFLFPSAYLFLIYFLVDGLDILDARALVRYGQFVLFLVIDILFLRILIGER